MARDEVTKTHLENVVLTAKTAHGDVAGDAIFAINAIDSDPMSSTAPAVMFAITNDGTISVGATGGSVGNDMTFYGDTSGATMFWDASDNRLEGSGATTILVGEETTGVTTAGGTTMIYGYAYHKTNALTGDLIGVRGGARCIKDSTSGKVIGGYFTAGNGTDTATGFSLGVLRGIYAGIVSKTGTGKTITAARGVEITMDMDAPTTAITTASGVKLTMQTGAAGGTITNSAGITISNAAAEGAGVELGSAILVGQTSRQAGWAYGLDFAPSYADDDITISHSHFSGAEIRLSHGGTIDETTDNTTNLTNTTIKVTGILDVTGNSTLASVDVGGGFTTSSGSGLTVGATGALSTNGAIVTESTVTSGKASAISGTFTAHGSTSGSIVIQPIAAGTNATTIQNQTGGSAKVITLPSATSTLLGLGVSTAGSVVLAGSSDGGITIAPIATGTGVATIQNQNVATSVITLPSATCTLPGLGLANTFAAAQIVTDTLTVTKSVTAAADVGTIRTMYGKYALTGSTPITTASNNMVGARGEFNIGTGGVLNFSAGSSFATGVQGKIVSSGTTTIGSTTSNQDARIQAIHAQGDFTGMTINGGQVSLIEADVQVRPTAINGVNQFNLIAVRDADADKTAQANSMLYFYGEAAFLMDLNEPETNGADWLIANTTSIEGNNMSYILKVCIDGNTGYIPVLGAVPS